MKNAKIDEVKEKLLEINQVIKQLDESLRATALRLLLPMYFPDAKEGQKHHAGGAEGNKDEIKPEPQDTDDLGNFLASFEQSKPAENVILLVAWLYSRYGAAPISAKEVQELGDSCGLVIPNRPDNTMRQAKNDGKSLFTQQGKRWRLTVTGELYIKSKFNVKKGNKPLPKE